MSLFSGNDGGMNSHERIYLTYIRGCADIVDSKAYL